MAVSNPATLSSANAEFGGDGKLSSLVQGGAFVPAGTSPGISTTVAGLALSQFNGVSNISFTLPTSVSATQARAGIGADAILTLGSAGTYSGTKSGTWVTPTSQASGLDVYVTYTGSAMSGSFNAWLPMNVNRTWDLYVDPPGVGGAGSASATATFQFRKSGTTTVIKTVQVAFSASAPK